MLDTHARAWCLVWWMLFLAERILPCQDPASFSVNPNLDRRGVELHMFPIP